MGTKINLDDLERKAIAATQDEWRWRLSDENEVLEGAHDGQVVLAAATDDLVCSVSDRAHIAANSPPVTLALIARVVGLERELAKLARHSIDVDDVDGDPWLDAMAVLEKGCVVP